MPGKIAVTPRSLSGSANPALAALSDRGYEIVYPSPGKTPTEDELLRSLPGCVGWLAGVEPITPRVLSAAKGLRVISRNGTGVDNIDLGAAQAQGIVVERAAGANARGVAELAITLMLSIFRAVPWSSRYLQQGDWQRRIGIEVQGRTLAVIGCGAIGREVADLALGLGMWVLGYDPLPSNSFARPGFRFASLEEALTMADAISFHCPPGERPILGADMLARLKPGSRSSTRRAPNSSTMMRCWQPSSRGRWPALRPTCSARSHRTSRPCSGMSASFSRRMPEASPRKASSARRALPSTIYCGCWKPNERPPAPAALRCQWP